MSKLNFSKSKFSKFLSSKGFYAAVALCLVGAGAATWLAVDRTITGIERNNSQIIQDQNRFSDFPIAEEAEKKEEGIVISKPEPIRQEASSESSSSSPASSSESEPPSEPVLKSEQSPVSEKSLTLAYALPISGNIINPFSNGELVKNLTLGDWRTHDGIDIAADRGVDILAVADGVVKDIRNDPLWGTVMTIDHPDGNQSIYSGLSSSLPVKVGDTVIGKQAIGKVDGVPCEISDENHIHFAMKNNGAWIDPFTVIPK